MEWSGMEWCKLAGIYNEVMEWNEMKHNLMSCNVIVM